jgi:hypothetical protein
MTEQTRFGAGQAVGAEGLRRVLEIPRCLGTEYFGAPESIVREHWENKSGEVPIGPTQRRRKCD